MEGRGGGGEEENVPGIRETREYWYVQSFSTG